jgi:hypothetical protein
MPMFLTISEGSNGNDAVPILATSDPQAIRAVLSALERRISGRRGVVRSVPTPTPAPSEAPAR